MSNRKYEDVKGYWLYSIKIPSVNKYYIGVSKQKCHKRWNKANYKGKSLEPYLNEWDSMTKTVLVDNLTKEQAYQYEDNIIRALKMNNLCINRQRSGLIASDKNAYLRELRKNNTELRERHNQQTKQWQKDNKEKVNEKQRQYRLNNKKKMREYDRQRRLKKKLEKQ